MIGILSTKISASKAPLSVVKTTTCKHEKEGVFSNGSFEISHLAQALDVVH